MKILMLQDSYPPYAGGYGQSCRNMAEALVCRGHRVVVLTTNIGGHQRTSSARVLPLLKPTPVRPVSVRVLGSWHRARYNVWVLRRVLEDHGFDIIMIWRLSMVSDWMLLAAEQSGHPVVNYVHDDWMMADRLDRWRDFWDRVPQRVDLRVLKATLKTTGVRRCLQLLLGRWLSGRPVHLDGQRTVFISRSCRDEYLEAGFPVLNSSVVYNGVDLARFYPRGTVRTSDPIRLLYVGEISPHKGVHVIVEAVGRLGAGLGRSCHLDIVGAAPNPDYLQAVLSTAKSARISDRVSILPPMANDDMPRCYRDHDILVFPSIGTERFPLVILEAMASGLPVVTTVTGGHAEFVENGHNCLVCRPGDASHMSEQISRLLRDLHLNRKIVHGGLQTVRDRFNLERTRDQMESFLRSRMVAKSQGHGA